MQKISPNPTVLPIEKANTENRLLTLDELYGVLKPYVNGYLSDEDIENAIAEGAIDSSRTENFDYTKWQHNLFNDLSVEELNQQAENFVKNTI